MRGEKYQPMMAFQNGHPQISKKEKTHVLVIPEMWERHSSLMFKTLPKDAKEKYVFHFVDVDCENYQVKFPQIYEKCRKIIQENDIEILYANEDTSAFIAAILTKEFPHLLGPSLESVFMCNNKYYTGLYVDSSPKPIHTLPINLEDDFHSNILMVEEEVGYPGILKPAMGAGAQGVYPYKNRKELETGLKNCMEKNQDVFGPMKKLIEKYINLDKFPLANKPIVLAQELVDQLAMEYPRKYMVGTEACVVEGKITMWPVCKMIYLPYGCEEPTAIFPGFQCPANLPNHMHDALMKAFKADLKNMISHGFDYSFAHGEYFVYENGDVQLMDMNPRMCVAANGLYAKCADSAGDNCIANLKMLYEATPPPTPKLNGFLAVGHWIWTNEVGLATDFVNVELGMTLPEISLRVSVDEDLKPEEGCDGIEVAYIYAQGTDFHDGFEKLRKLRKSFLKKTRSFPLHIFVDKMKDLNGWL